jgi:hypothetical protein
MGLKFRVPPHEAASNAFVIHNLRVYLLIPGKMPIAVVLNDGICMAGLTDHTQFRAVEGHIALGF